MRMELFQFLGHCLKGRMKLEKVIQYPENLDDDSEKPDEQHNNAEKDMINNIKPIPYLFRKTQQRMTQRMNHLNHKVDLNALRGTKKTTKE